MDLSSDAAAKRILRSISTPLIRDEDIEALDWELMRLHDHSLSSGERTVVYTALAVWNGNLTATVAELLALDNHTLANVLGALIELRGIEIVSTDAEPDGAGAEEGCWGKGFCSCSRCEP